MKKLLFLKVLLLSISIITSITSTGLYFNKQKDESNINLSETEEIEIKEEDSDLNEKEPITENIIKDGSTDDEPIKNDISTNNHINKNNLESNNVSYSNVIDSSSKIEERNTSNQEIKVNEQPKEAPKVEEVKDDIIDTNSFFYSIHQGNIDVSSQSNCLSAGNEIAFIDTVDINYYRCYEVTSTTGKVLGYYLNIFCESGNCNRYKSQIDMSKYR